MKKARFIPLVLAATMLLTCLLPGCQLKQETAPVQADIPVTEAPTAAPTEVPTEAPTEAPTEPQPTCPPDGDPTNVTSKGSYTGAPLDVAKNAKTVVATSGDMGLSNALLQIYYRIAVGTYQREQHEIAPDFSQPLESQMCPLVAEDITWQQYFLQQALNSWHSQTAMVQRSKTEKLPLEEAYQPVEKKHKQNIKTEIYNMDLLYGYNTAYRHADAHQAYLDNLPQLLQQLADLKGCETTAALANKLAGVGTNDTYLMEYAQLLNEAYMFLTTLSYYIEPTDDQIGAQFTNNEAPYADLGITKDGHYVNFRQILLVPEGATVADDGTVTASDGSWSECKQDAESLLKKWRSDPTEVYFGELAYANSRDTGSNRKGGLYTNVAKGQLAEELDAWCFDPARQAGDTVVIKTSMGYHVLYLSKINSIWYEQAKLDVIAKALAAEVTAAQNTFPMTVDYRSILLQSPEADDIILTAGELLYPDIAHERFPKAPLYFQQDYPNSKYGAYNLVTYGCGITSMAMLTSYMTDEEWTPPVMAEMYGRYCSDAGTAHTLFMEVPSYHDFYAVRRVYNWNEALDAMKDGYMVITLQRDGFWTRGGHYLLLHNLIETENGTEVQVWDSNILNYKKLEGHTTGSFPLSTVPPNARLYWIYEKKVVHVDACARCAEPTEESYSPSALFPEGYTCPKCQTAMNRRDAYLDILDVVQIRTAIPEEAPTEPAATEATEATEAAPTEEFIEEPEVEDTYPAEDQD